MADVASLVLSVVRVGVFLLGIGVTWVSYTAYRRTGERFLRDATVGFGILAGGVFVEGVLFELFAMDLTTVHIVESVAVGAGLLVLHHSLRR